jgi:hypothetical protein
MARCRSKRDVLSMKRALLIGMLSILVVVGGAIVVVERPETPTNPAPEDRITILKPKLIRLRMPTQGYQPYAPHDVTR